jgi:hypothetical protein
LSVPGAAAPPFWVTPNHGSAPIVKAELAGVTTTVAVLPLATDAVTVGAVDAASPLIVTEHQLRKFRTVSATSVLVPASGTTLGASATAASTGPAGAGDSGAELLLHATAPVIASAAMLPMPLHPILFFVNIGKASH